MVPHKSYDPQRGDKSLGNRPPLFRAPPPKEHQAEDSPAHSLSLHKSSSYQYLSGQAISTTLVMHQRNPRNNESSWSSSIVTNQNSTFLWKANPTPIPTNTNLTNLNASLNTSDKGTNPSIIVGVTLAMIAVIMLVGIMIHGWMSKRVRSLERTVLAGQQDILGWKVGDDVEAERKAVRNIRKLVNKSDKKQNKHS